MEYQRALGGAHAPKAVGNVQGGNYYEGPKYKRTTAGLNVPYCGDVGGLATEFAK